MISLDHPASWFGIALCASGIFLAWRLGLTELRRHHTPLPADKPFVSHGRLSRRLFGAFLLGLVMVLLAVGLYAVPFEGRPVLFVVYWGGFCLLLVLMAFTAVVDLLDTHRIIHHQNVNTIRRVIERSRPSQEPDSPAEQPQPSKEHPS